MKNTILIAVLLFLAISTAAYGQSISIYDIDTTNFPTMKAKFYAFDKDGNQVRPSASELSINEDGVPRTITNVSCLTPAPTKAISSVLTFDIGVSMGHGNLDLAKAAANSWVNSMPLGQSECAISSFDDLNYLNQDFSTDKIKLLNAIEKLTAKGGTDYNSALINPLSSGLFVTKNANNKKVLVLLTDGLAPDPNINQIIKEAKNQNVTIYVVTFGISCPQSLKSISIQTGGLWFEKISTVQDAEYTYKKILSIAQGGEPCEITWESGLSCGNIISTLDEKIQLKLNWKNYNSDVFYTKPTKAIASLSVSPVNISFGERKPDTNNDTIIKITADNSEIVIKNIKRKFGVNNFVILNANYPIVIPKNTTIDLSIRFTPSDSDKVYVSFEIETDICSGFFSLNGGYSEKNMKSPTLKLTYPNGNEPYIIGNRPITWEGISPLDTVSLDYSIDSGKTWYNITKKATSLKYEWNNETLTNNSKCLIKVSQFFTSDNKVLLNSIKLLNEFKDEKITDIKFSPNSQLIASISTNGYDSQIKLWDINNGKLIRTLSSIKGRYQLISFNSVGNLLASIGGDNDSFIRIWEVNTGKLLKTISGLPCAGALSFSPDGNYLVAASGCGYDKTAKIWDINTGQMLKSFYTNDYILCLSYNPYGNIIAVGSTNSLDLWELSTGNIKNISSYGTNNVAFSKDGSLLFSSHGDHLKQTNLITGFKNIYEGEVQEFSISLENKIITSKFILFKDSLDKQLDSVYKQYYDITYGKMIYEEKLLIDNNNEQYLDDKGLSISPDGNILAIAINRAIKLMNIGLTTLQFDQSDTIISIVNPIIKAKDVNMTLQYVGTPKDVFIEGFIENIGTYNCRIDSIYFEGEHFEEFQLVSGNPPFIIKANQNYNIEIRFKPKTIGKRHAIIVIKTQAKTLRYNITGEGILPTIQIINNLINFGKVETGNYNDLSDQVTIKNISSDPIIINETKINYPNEKDFAITYGGGSFTLSPNDTKLIDLRFKPSDVGRTSSTLEFHYNGVGSPAVVQLFGEGINPTSISRNLTDKQMLKISPNPVNSIIIIDLNLKEVGKTEVAIYNLMGENVKTLISQDITEKGIMSIDADLSDLSNGQYVVIFKTPTYTERQNVLILK